MVLLFIIKTAILYYDIISVTNLEQASKILLRYHKIWKLIYKLKISKNAKLKQYN